MCGGSRYRLGAITLGIWLALADRALDAASLFRDVWNFEPFEIGDVVTARVGDLRDLLRRIGSKCRSRRGRCMTVSRAVAPQDMCFAYRFASPGKLCGRLGGNTNRFRYFRPSRSPFLTQCRSRSCASREMCDIRTDSTGSAMRTTHRSLNDLTSRRLIPFVDGPDRIHEDKPDSGATKHRLYIYNHSHSTLAIAKPLPGAEQPPASAAKPFAT